MKKLEDLDIQPTPWSVDEDGCIVDANGWYVTGCTPGCGCDCPTTILVKNAPKLYAALREAIVEVCHACPSCGAWHRYVCHANKGTCFVQKWREVLDEASQEPSGSPIDSTSSQQTANNKETK